MFDTVVRGGTIIDGTGGAPFTADVAITDGVIVQVGRVLSSALEEIDADGALVTPGFIDIHTHYDGQFLWDCELEPSFSNGVTTVIAGNCGVGFAPARAEHRHNLIDIMEGVEDIPGIVLDEGLDWSWESFPDYLDKLDARNFTMDVAVHLTHAPLRLYVMGERAVRHEPATETDLAEMKRLVREAMAVGAVGFSGTRILEHRASSGANVPGTFADERELSTLAEAMGESGRGVFQLVPLGAAGDLAGTPNTTAERLEEHERIVRIARATSGRPVTYILHAMNHAPEEWRELLEATRGARAEGLDIRAQIASRGLGWIFTLDGYHLFRARPSYVAIAHLPRAERAAAMREPARRAAILGEADACDQVAAQVLKMARIFKRIMPGTFAIGQALDYEPPASRRIEAVAGATGRAMEEVVYDTLAESDGNGLLIDFAMNYTDCNLNAAYELLADPITVSGLGDGGAHLPMTCDAAMTTFHLSFWARDRARGSRLPPEAVVRKLTGDPAQLYGLDDRGLIKVGKRADINIIDLNKLESELPHMVFDLPSGGPRLVQKSRGYLATLVSGVVTRRDDQATGALPGRLIRMGRLPRTRGLQPTPAIAS
jgi:N-acyl-D-amino-acid deacylase